MEIDPKRYTLHSEDIGEFRDIDLDEEVVIMDGRRFTEADAQALADIAEAKVLERRQAQQRGSITLPREELEKARTQTAAKSVSVSKW